MNYLFFLETKTYGLLASGAFIQSGAGGIHVDVWEEETDNLLLYSLHKLTPVNKLIDIRQTQ